MVLPDLQSTPISSAPLPRHSMLRPIGKRARDELSHRTGLAGSQHEIVRHVRLRILCIPPHMPPVAPGLEIAEIERASWTVSMRAMPRDLAGELEMG